MDQQTQTTSGQQDPIPAAFSQAGSAKSSSDILGAESNLMQQKQQADFASKTAEGGVQARQAGGEANLQQEYADRAKQAQEERNAQIKPYDEFKPTKQSGSDLAKMFSMVAALGFISGGAGREKALGAMKNMTAAMTGYQQGREDLFQNEMKQFEENMKSAKMHNDQIDNAYREALETFVRDRDAGMAKLKAAAALEHNQSVIPYMLKTGQIDNALKVLNDRRKALEKVEQQGTQMRQQHEYRMQEIYARDSLKRQAEGAGATQITPDVVDFYAQQAVMGDQSWRSGLGRTKEGTSLILAVDRRIPSFAKELGISPTEFGSNKAAYAAKAYALKRRQDYVSAVDNLSRQVDGASKMVEDMLKTGPKDSGLRIINQWLQAGRSATNDPDVARFNMLMQDLGRQHQRMVTAAQSAGQLHVASQETADKLFNTSNSPQEIIALIKQLRQEAARDKQAGIDTINELRQDMQSIGRPAENQKQNAATQQKQRASPGEKVYRDANGNRAVQRNGQWIEVE